MGNIVIFSGKLYEIEAISEEGVTLGGKSYPLSDIEPVVLDGRILVKCGFKAYSNLFEYPAKRFFPFMLKAKENEAGYSLLLDYRPVTGLDFLYLHRFQNLFFAFTGSELHVSTDETATGAKK